jgi:hypothetical protein
MIEVIDLHLIGYNTIDHQVRRAGNDELTGLLQIAKPAQIGVINKQANRLMDRVAYPTRCVFVACRNVLNLTA